MYCVPIFLVYLAILGWVNQHKKAHSATTAENQIPINHPIFLPDEAISYSARKLGQLREAQF